MKRYYDVIVIGAGIGGLTTAAYLAKTGLGVLVVERREKVGGYCGTFTREGFLFDEAVHYLNSMRPGGILRRVCEETGADKYIRVVQVDPSDILLMPDLHIAIYHDQQRTIEELSQIFPDESKSIVEFFHLLYDFNATALFARYQGLTFQELLDGFFRNSNIKVGLGLFATTMGLAPERLSALAALAYYRGSIVDGGYHPIGGAQSVSEGLYQSFLDHGGEAILGTAATKILVSSGVVKGVELSNGEHFGCDIVVSNCDATQTFVNLLGDEAIGREEIVRVTSLKPSLSLLVVYLGIDKLLLSKVPDCCNLWYFPHDQLDSSMIDITTADAHEGYVHVGLSSLHDRTMAPEGCESLVLFSGASYKNEEYWVENKYRLSDILIQRACHAMPSLRECGIKVKLSATPPILYRYTLNRGGAYRGWETSLEQTRWGLVSERSRIEGLYLTGHWITTPLGNGGVSGVAQLGRRLAQRILRLRKRKLTVIGRV